MDRLPELTGKVDAFFARVHARHGADMQCGSGCSDCCHVRLTITSVEANAIRALGARVVPNKDPDRCAALDDGRCQIYAARPIVCRSHGAPIRMRRDSLPVVENCFRNFQHTEPDPDCIVDQTTLSTLVLTVDRDAGGNGTRVDLADVIAELAASC